ncbi:hypothetical protein SESBI_41712 [Sesbania bispinosa]|nr:hypothetical protein SESBI_41712 [Sesbania bispinosa]
MSGDSVKPCPPPFLPSPPLSSSATTLGFLFSIHSPLAFHSNHSLFLQTHENIPSEPNGSEFEDDKLSEDLVKLKGDQSKDLKKDWLAALHTVITGILRVDPWTVPWTAKTIVQMEEYETSDSNTSFTSSSHAPKSVVPAGHSRYPSLKRCRTLSRRIFHKYLNFLRPLCRRLRGHKSGSNTETVAKRGEAVKNRRYYSETSPRISVAFSADDWRKSCDSESSIYEAVLHCKRSIGGILWFTNSTSQ